MGESEECGDREDSELSETYEGGGCVTVSDCMSIQSFTNLSLCKHDTKTGTMPELMSSSIGGFLSLERIFLQWKEYMNSVNQSLTLSAICSNPHWQFTRHFLKLARPSFLSSLH